MTIAELLLRVSALSVDAESDITVKRVDALVVWLSRKAGVPLHHESPPIEYLLPTANPEDADG